MQCWQWQRTAGATRAITSLIMHFDPLVRLWTMPFESKHSYFKGCICYSPNFKNVCLTLAEKHQLWQAYKCAGSYFPCDIEAKQSVPLFVDTFSDTFRLHSVTFISIPLPKCVTESLLRVPRTRKASTLL